MKVLVTGKGGQLAWELERTAPDSIELQAYSSKELDITDLASVEEKIKQFMPDIVINAAAYTAVDKAEDDKAQAYLVNETGTKNLANSCAQIHAKLIHISTDFVFDGKSTLPYAPQDLTNPVNEYGASKLAGEKCADSILGPNATIIRTAWVYSCNGNNFVKTMLKLMSMKDELGIVYDQVGTPTWANGLAKLIWQLVSEDGVVKQPLESESATYLHWTDAGVASWYDFAVAIHSLALEKGILSKPISIRPIPATAYPTPAKRPNYSVIDKSLAESIAGIRTTHWYEQLSHMLDQYSEMQQK